MEILSHPVALICLIPTWLAGMVFATIIAKNGLLESGIKIPPDPLIKAGVFWVVVSIVTGIIVKKYDPSFKLDSSDLEVWLVVGSQFLWIPFFRHILMPNGQIEFNKATSRTKYYTMRFYRPGSIDRELAELLRGDDRAQKTLKLYDRAREKQKKGTNVTHREDTINLSEKWDEAEYDGNFRLQCPGCAHPIHFPAYQENRVISGQCQVCGAMIAGRRQGDELKLSIHFLRPIRVVTIRHRLNMAIVHIEKALLLRMMGMFDEALAELESAKPILEHLLICEPQNDEFLQCDSLRLFREAEIEQVRDNKAKAKELYLKSLEVGGSAVPQNDLELTNELLAQLDK